MNNELGFIDSIYFFFLTMCDGNNNETNNQHTENETDYKKIQLPQPNCINDHDKINSNSSKKNDDENNEWVILP